MFTTDCTGWDEDKVMFEKWGLRPMESFEVEALRELVSSASLPVAEEKQVQAVA
jgi:biotin synthase